MTTEFKDFQLKEKLAQESVGWLQGMAGGLLGVSFLLWSLPPFFLSKSKTVDLWVQGLSLLGAISGSTMVLAIGYKLKKVEPLFQAEEQQAQEDFFHQLAAQRYYQESVREAMVAAALTEPKPLPMMAMVGMPSPQARQEFQPTQSKGQPPIVQSEAEEPNQDLAEPSFFIPEAVTNLRANGYLNEDPIPLGLRLSDPPPPTPPAMPDEQDERVQELWEKLNAPGCEWLMQLLLTKPLLIWGEQCSGKTSFASFLALLRVIFFGHTVSVADPHAHQNTWPQVFEMYGAEYNYNAINSRLVAYYQRLKAANLAHTSIWDEVTQYQESCDPALAGRFLKSILSDVRKPPEFPILLSHGNTLSTLGGGRGGIKKMQSRGLVEVNLRAVRDRLGNLKPALRGTVTGLDLDEKGDPTQYPISLESWMQPKYLLGLFPELVQGGFVTDNDPETDYPVAV
ncbi:MAG: hypothetical protein HC835_08660 [Oscillatoriales cyanobacterium RM2_1_1]|nr:hypothetical protein [Oscillatoriales cyanobacterium SM2_3_0]NJO45690.1 hypothetical protein [Oscillatoriales cyanobacterium RM2_1_1]